MTTFLRCERLEPRTVPALFGRPWADHEATISFVPDGTIVDGAPSVLFQKMQQSNLTQANWQTQILRAAQTWLEAVNLNLGVVADQGQTIGISGEIQGDPRFGDIRVAARPLSGDVLAVTIPPGVIGSTRVGDIVINSSKSFAIGNVSGKYDLYTVLLQEMGHALGLGNSTDPASPMYETYRGVRTGLTATDKSNMAAMYNVRPASANDDNDSLATATAVPGVPASFANNAIRTIVASGEITTPSDVDYYSFTVPSNVSGVINVLIHSAGRSLLVPAVTVYRDGQTAAVASAVSSSPLLPDASVAFTVTAGQTYRVKIAKGASTTFDVGAYDVRLIFDPAYPNPAPAAPVVYNGDPLLTNNTPLIPTELSSDPSFAPHSVYTDNAKLDIPLDVDYYRVVGPSSLAGVTALSVVVRSVGSTTFNPEVVVTNALGISYSVGVLSNGNGEYVAQVPVSAANQDFRIGVRAQSGSPSPTGNYELTADFFAPIINLSTLTSGTVSHSHTTDDHTITIAYSSIMHFTFSVAGGDALLSGGVQFTVTDSAGRTVFESSGKPGQTRSVETFLPQGTYTVHAADLTNGLISALLPGQTYVFRGTYLSDPIGVGNSNGDGVNGTINNEEWVVESLDAPANPVV